MRDPVAAAVSQEYGLTHFARNFDVYPTPGHLGRDYASWDGAFVMAPEDSAVVFVGEGYPTSWGYHIKLQSTVGRKTRQHILAHLTPGSAKVDVGAGVREGLHIADSGHSPNWPPHLHWQIIADGPAVMNGSIDPRTLLEPHRYTVQALKDYASLMAIQRGLDPVIFRRQINQESGWDMYVMSSAGAIGIAQIVPRFHPKMNPWEPYEALTYAAALMASHMAAFGRIDYALAAYNAGADAVRQHHGVPPYRQTQNYVRSILGGLPEEDHMTITDEMAGKEFLKGKWEELAATAIQVANRAHAGDPPTDAESLFLNTRYKELITDWHGLWERERARADGG
jgi:hypothetical protein